MISNSSQSNQILVNALKECVFTRSLESVYFDKIVQISCIKKIGANCRIFSQGEHLKNIYLLLSGDIKLQRLAINGNEKVIKIVHAKETFAEAALFSGNKSYPVSAIAVSESLVVEIRADLYLKLLKKSSTLYLNLLSNLSTKLHWMIDEVDRLMLHNATFRVISYLLNCIPKEGQASTGVKLAAPKNVIASRLSIKPETLSRTLKDLANKNLIKLNGTSIEIININELKRLITL